MGEILIGFLCGCVLLFFNWGNALCECCCGCFKKSEYERV